jgi:membrane protease YdiL (CAAX protease family)
MPAPFQREEEIVSCGYQFTTKGDLTVSTVSTVPSIVPADKKGFKTFIKRNPLISMYIIMFTIAWSVMVPQALYSQGITSAPLPMWLEILTGWAPGIAAVIVTSIIKGRTGIRELFRRFLVKGIGAQWYFVSLFLLAIIILGGIGLHALFGGAMPVIPVAGESAVNIVLSFLLLILVGALFNTEEIVWRGFALPGLQEKYSVLVACLLVAVPEVLLHLPNFWMKNLAFYQTVGIFWFSAFSVAMVLIYAFVFNKTKGSLFFVTIMHASQNAWANLLSDNTARPFQFTVALAWMIAIALIFTTNGQLGRPSDQSESTE